MPTNMNPYLNFNGTAGAAMEFYQSVFGGELHMNKFDEFPMPEGMATPEGIMHANLTTESGFILMASDMPPGMQLLPGNNFSVSISGTDAADLRRYWDQLSEGGEVTMPLEKQMWGDEFGQCIDRFGIPWMVNIVAEHPQA